jgi:hypothetical protein
VRAIERLGSILVEMRHAPDPRILVEVALVQLTSDEAGGDVNVLAARIERVEQQVKELRENAVAAAPAAPRDPATGRAVVGGAARRAVPAPAAEATPTTSEPGQEPVPEPPPTPTPTPAAAAAAVAVPDAWRDVVKPQLKPLIRALYSAGEFTGDSSGDTWRFSVPNEAHGAKCAEHRAVVEAALAAATGSPVTIEFVSGGVPVASAPSDGVVQAPEPAAAPTPARSGPRESAMDRATRAAATHHDDEEAVATTATAVLPDDDEVDLSDLTDAPPESVKTPIDRLADAFPGSELMNDD